MLALLKLLTGDDLCDPRQNVKNTLHKITQLYHASCPGRRTSMPKRFAHIGLFRLFQNLPALLCLVSIVKHIGALGTALAIHQ
jgi:hypothetical protein